MSKAQSPSKESKFVEEQAETVSFLSGKALDKFEAYRSHDAFHPSNISALGFFGLLAFMAYLIVCLLDILDRAFISGLRNIPHLVAAYIVICIVRLWVECEWSLREAWKRGLKFQDRQNEIAKLRSKLESSPKGPWMPHGGQPKILCVTGYGGGGHEATLNGLREVMAEAGFKPTLVDVPYWALHFDATFAHLLSLLGIDHGDEAAKLCGRVWSERQPDLVFQTSGMILRPSFYDAVDIGPDRGAALSKLGLDPARRTVLVFWGGVGSAKVAEAGRVIQGARERVNVIFLCGRNKQLLEQVRGAEWPCKVVAEGFTDKVSFYMQLSDMIICKPGPGVASEAAYLGLPMLVEWSPFTLPQEVAVCKWIVSRGLGLGFSRVSQLPKLVDRMCDLLGPFQADRRLRPIPIACEGMTGVDMNPADNKAVFEVPSIVNHILLETYPHPEDGKPPAGSAGASGAAATGAARKED